ncbi:hypothetical protein CRG98_007689 [Punica granatum]|uniref:Uncharacterized protein n=1 Tax=Punica granatum TaxID=22663 RepID=A0A2I0KTX4_PUNGR|nr:hypothetical protein CRG98_007689 [Punica granatum]
MRQIRHPTEQRTITPVARLASGKSNTPPSQQQSRPPAKHNCPSNKADLRQSKTAQAASPVFGSPIGNNSSNKTSLQQINARPPQQRGRLPIDQTRRRPQGQGTDEATSSRQQRRPPVSHMRFSLFSETRWVSVSRVSPTYSTAFLRQHSQARTPHLPLYALRPRIYLCIYRFMGLGPTFTALWVSAPHLPLYRLRPCIYRFIGSGPAFTALWAPTPHLFMHLLLYGPRPRIHCFMGYGSAFAALWALAPHLLL